MSVTQMQIKNQQANAIQFQVAAHSLYSGSKQNYLNEVTAMILDTFSFEQQNKNIKSLQPNNRV